MLEIDHYQGNDGDRSLTVASLWWRDGTYLEIRATVSSRIQMDRLHFRRIDNNNYSKAICKAILDVERNQMPYCERAALLVLEYAVARGSVSGVFFCCAQRQQRLLTHHCL
jgi:hypothetical protein